MAGRRYTYYPEDWYTPTEHTLSQCCDCGLVHNVSYRTDEKGNIQVKITRNERETKKVRRRASVRQSIAKL